MLHDLDLLELAAQRGFPVQSQNIDGVELRRIEGLAQRRLRRAALRGEVFGNGVCELLRQRRIVLGLAHDDVEQPAQGRRERGFRHWAATTIGWLTTLSTASASAFTCWAAEPNLEASVPGLSR